MRDWPGCEDNGYFAGLLAWFKKETSSCLLNLYLSSTDYFLSNDIKILFLNEKRVPSYLALKLQTCTVPLGYIFGLTSMRDWQQRTAWR